MNSISAQPSPKSNPSSRSLGSRAQAQIQGIAPEDNATLMRFNSKIPLHDITSMSAQEQAVVDGGEPADDANPQNWSPGRKRRLFFALMTSSILCDGAMTWGATLVVPQAVEWGLPPDKVATSLNYGILLQGIGGVLAVPVMDAFGRLPTWIWPQIVTLGTVVGCCFAPDFNTFTALRALQGLFGTIPQVIGLPIIHDMYAPAEWHGMINLWGTTFLIGPFFGPALAGYLQYGTGDWRIAFGVLAALYVVSTICVLVFGRETYYSRISGVQQTARIKAWFGLGNTGLPKVGTMVSSTVVLFRLAFLKLPVLLIGLSTLVNFTWPIGVTTTISPILHAAPYLFNNLEDASMRFAGVIGALLGFALGYGFNERLASSPRWKTYIWRSEIRLYGVFLSVPFMTLGLLTYGLTLHYGKSWVGLAFGWVMVNMGMVVSTVSITSFALEKYPEHSTAIAAIINGWRTTGGFSVSYFQPAWLGRTSPVAVFGTQAAIVAVSAVLLVAPVIWMGRKRGIDNNNVRGM